MEGYEATETEIEIAQHFWLCTVWCGILVECLLSYLFSIKNGNDHGGFGSQRTDQPTVKQ